MAYHGNFEHPEDVSYETMLDTSSLEQSTELLPIPRYYRNANHLIPRASPEGSETGSYRDSLDTEVTQIIPKRIIYRGYGSQFQGWKFTAFLAFLTSLIVLSFNVGFLLYTITHPWQEDRALYPVQYENEYNNQRNKVVYEGDCDKVHRFSIGLHLLINLLSTALLSASNFGMQCLSAPTRQAIDRAHRNASWLDIGVPSVRNISQIPVGRSIMWLFLAISSLPFHLVYNSAIYQTTSVFSYDIFAGPGSLPQKSWNEVQLENGENLPRKTHSFQTIYYAAQNGTLQHLDNLKCLDAFAQTFQSTYSKLLLVTEDVEGSDSYALVYTNPVLDPMAYFLASGNGYLRSGNGPYDWLCPQDVGRLTQCNDNYLPTIRSQIANNNWTVQGPVSGDTFKHIDYCLAEKAPQLCKLQYSFPITMFVIAFNIVKSSILLYLWIGVPDAPILVIGDAIASFLRHQDPYTQGDCLLAYRDVKNLHRSPESILNRAQRDPEQFHNKRRLWRAAASTRRWSMAIILWASAMVTCTCLLGYGLSQIGSGVDIWKQQLGAIVAGALIKGSSWPNSLISNVFIANSPQLIFSFLYFAFNSLLTTMALAAEWSGYAHHRKGLRVSNNPRLSQRSTYFLSIPYRFSIPLIVATTILHWLISESLFLVSVEAFDSDSLRDPSRDLFTCGFSPTAIVSSLAVGIFMFLCLVGLSFRPFETAMPVAGSCSLAIAAACHPEFDPNENRTVQSQTEDEDMALLPVRWGAVPVNGRIGHCSFTSKDVDMPGGGQIYK